MKQNSDKNFPPVSDGVTLRISILDRNKRRADFRNVFAVAMNVTDNGFYKLGTKTGALKQFYARLQFIVCKRELF